MLLAGQFLDSGLTGYVIQGTGGGGTEPSVSYTPVAYQPPVVIVPTGVPTISQQTAVATPTSGCRPGSASVTSTPAPGFTAQQAPTLTGAQQASAVPSGENYGLLLLLIALGFATYHAVKERRGTK